MAMELITTANATLVASAGSDEGSFCDDECYDHGCTVVVSCDCSPNHKWYDGNAYGFNYCNRVNAADTECYLGSVGNKHYYCSFGQESACSLCSCNNQTSSWYSDSNNRVVRDNIVINNDIYYQCRYTTTKEYACAAGTYYYGGSGQWMACQPCPNADEIYTNSALTIVANGTSTTGNTGSAVSVCYLAPGTYYDSTGTLTVSGYGCTY